MAENLGNLLDSAVKTAVYRLAHAKRPEYPPPLAQQPAVDRSRVDFLYYEGNEPYYDYEYYNDYNEVRQGTRPKDPPPPWLEQKTSTKYRWGEKHAPAWRPPRPHQEPPDSISNRVDQVGGAIARVGEAVTAAAGGMFPGILALPFVAAASYYLLVVNAPTPVVKERMSETADFMLGRLRDNYQADEFGAAVVDTIRQLLPRPT